MSNQTDTDGRQFLRSNWELLGDSDQGAGVPRPPMEEPVPAGAAVIKLPAPHPEEFRGVDLTDALLNRRSRRSFRDQPLSLAALSFLLFVTQGVQSSTAKNSKRPVPSAGARHPFETYVAAMAIDGLPPALYRYLPFSHSLCRLRASEDLRAEAEAAILGQGWGAPVIFFWTAIPYRTEWRYEIASAKLIALDAGHLCQNLYLACEAVGAGTCAIGAYDQALCDVFLGVDGRNELTVYVAPVGMRPESLRGSGEAE
jgi:SagB-type dehydrogenase family enzyme